MTSSRPRRADWLGALITGAVLVAVMTYPTATQLGSYGRIDTGDGRYSIWNIGWIDHALLTDPRRLLDANIFYPHTGVLAYSELNLVAGVLGLPVYAATHNAIAALNAAILIALLAAFVLMWALVRMLTGSSGAGLCAATGFTFCPYVQAHTPHIQLLMVFALPLVFVAFHRFHESPTAGRAAALGGALALAGLACAYYGIFAGLALGAIALLFAEKRRNYWLGLAAAAVVTALVVAPVFVPYLRARAQVSAVRTTNIEELRGYSATPKSYITSPSYIHEEVRDRARLFTPAPESLFPGVALTLLAFAGAVATFRSGDRRERRIVAAYLALAVAACWASFGPDAGLYKWLQAAVPAMGLLRAPVRLGVVVTFAIAVLAGFGARRLVGTRRWAPALVVPLMALELATLPWPLVPAERVPDAYRLLASAPRGAVVEFPFMYKRTDFHNHSRYMFTSIYHWQPLVNGYSDVIPPDFYELAGPINAFPDPASFALMRRLDVRYVIWHMDPRSYDAPAREKLLARFARYPDNLRRLTTDEDVWLFEIVAWP
ncbi:MAG: hypothetical protein ABI652_02070 [Acidobacteriota bacterium]